MAAPATYPLPTIAKLLMLTERRVQQLVNDGHIPRAARGRYELVPVVQGYIRFLRDRAINGDVSEGGEASDRARLMKAKADIAVMEAERLAEELVPTAEVEAAWTEIMARVRARMLAVPSRAAPMAIGQPSIEAAHEVIETFVHEALAELAATEVGGIAAAGRGDAPGAEDDGAASEAEDIGMG